MQSKKENTKLKPDKTGAFNPKLVTNLAGTLVYYESMKQDMSLYLHPIHRK